MAVPQFLLTALPVTTAATTPVTGSINPYNATAGALNVTLPALSTVNPGAYFIVKKTDSTAHAVTFTCNGSDTFDNGSTSIALTNAGQMYQLQAINPTEGALTPSEWFIVQSGGGAQGAQGAQGPSGGAQGAVGAQGPAGAAQIISGGALQVEMLANLAAYQAISSPDSNTLYLWFG